MFFNNQSRFNTQMGNSEDVNYIKENVNKIVSSQKY